MALTYNPLVFEVPTLEDAKQVIVTPQGGLDTDDRWERETPYLARLLGEGLGLKAGQLVVDYGCGVGRLSKALIEMYDCQVLGVDISKQMRAMAPDYVGTSAFSVVSRRMLQVLVQRGLRADAAIGAWVFQHCFNPAEDLALVSESVKSGALVGVVNNASRAVPTVEEGWKSDEIDVRRLLHERFAVVSEGGLDPEIVSPYVAERTYWGLYQRA